MHPTGIPLGMTFLPMSRRVWTPQYLLCSVGTLMQFLTVSWIELALIPLSLYGRVLLLSLDSLRLVVFWIFGVFCILPKIVLPGPVGTASLPPALTSLVSPSPGSPLSQPATSSLFRFRIIVLSTCQFLSRRQSSQVQGSGSSIWSSSTSPNILR